MHSIGHRGLGSHGLSRQQPHCPSACAEGERGGCRNAYAQIRSPKGSDPIRIYTAECRVPTGSYKDLYGRM